MGQLRETRGFCSVSHALSLRFLQGVVFTADPDCMTASSRFLRCGEGIAQYSACFLCWDFLAGI